MPERRTRHIVSLLAILLAFMLAFSGCGGDKTANAPASQAPQSIIDGYYSSSQSVSGGVDTQQPLNLREIMVTKEQADIVVSMEFREGSLLFDMEEKPAQAVPRYTTEWIPGIDRLVLNIYGLVHWDYRIYDDELKDTPIQGIFKQPPVNDPEMLTRLYINLKDQVVYRIEEKKNILLLHLRVVPEEVKSNHYVVLNAFDEYVNGKITRDDGFTPTLCSDKINVMLISQPFSTDQEAREFLEEKKKELLPSLSGKNAAIVELKSNALPDYDEEGALNTYTNTPISKKDGVENTAPTLITNGRILCWRPDGMAYVYVTPFYIKTNDGQNTSYEKIYVYNLQEQKATLLTEFEYTSVSKAEYSDDGQYLAFLEGEFDSNRLLCVYDFNDSSKQVATASEAGLGANTVNFTWGKDANQHTIYAITGEGATLQLMSYTPGQNGGTPTVETLAEEAFTQGDMGFYDGVLYYTQGSSESEQSGIFSFNLTTKTASRIIDGLSFELNRKSGDLAIINEAENEIQLYNVKTKAKKTVFKGRDVKSAVWSGDGSMLFYSIYKYDDPETKEKYTLALYQYKTLSQDSKQVMETIEGEIMPSDKSSELLMVYSFKEEERLVPITYKLEVGSR